MKKLFGLILVVGILVAFSSCKKEYTCCYYDATGAEVSFNGAGCVTEKMSKSDMQDLEDSMNSAATLVGWSAKCE